MWPLSIIRWVIMSPNINQEEESLYAYLCTTSYFPRYKMPFKYTRKFLPIVLCVSCGRHLIFVRSSPSKKEGIHSYMYVWDPTHNSKKVCVWEPSPSYNSWSPNGRFSHLFLKNERDLVPRDLTSCLSLCASKMVGNKCDVTINSKS
jgi:hypothetical protein